MGNWFHDELDALNTHLLEMGSMIEYAIETGVQAMEQRNAELARTIVSYDREIDQKEREIESQCLKLLLRQHPVARDLRFISAALKMVTDMERVGDQAADISEIVSYIAQEGYIKQLEHIPKMAEKAVHMVKRAVDAFINRDLDLGARAVIDMDDEVDGPVRRDQARADRVDPPEFRYGRAGAGSFDDRQVFRAHWRPRGEHRRVGGIRHHRRAQRGENGMIYAVEDDRNIRELIVYALRQSGFEAEGFEDGSRLMELPAPELVILDIMLPGEDGLSILRRLRADPVRKRVPVILLTALSGEENRVDGFEAGADGYITKPFGVMELIARVKAVLRRGGYGLRVGGIELDEKRHAVYANGQNVQLTLKEYELLSFLMAHAGTAFDREQLLSEVWGMDYFGGTRTVDVHVQTLRQKLGSCGSQIHTVRGVGYRMEGDRT